LARQLFGRFDVAVVLIPAGLIVLDAPAFCAVYAILTSGGHLVFATGRGFDPVLDIGQLDDGQHRTVLA
jgi:hypothetical protein